MKKNNEQQGVWRTVGGRRIFIADGEDLTSAMKKSGKFKSFENKEQGYMEDKAIAVYNSYPQIIKDMAEQQGKSKLDLVREYGPMSNDEINVEEAKAFTKYFGAKKSFETDLYGNGKQDRFELENGTLITHTKELFGEKVNEWAIMSIENGTINERPFKNYKDLKKYLDKK